MNLHHGSSDGAGAELAAADNVIVIIKYLQFICQTVIFGERILVRIFLVKPVNLTYKQINICVAF